MKYVNPSIEMENVEISDVIQTSDVNIAYVNKGTGQTDGEGNEIKVMATQVTVDVSKLF